MSMHTYIGARYVPRFLGTYDPTQTYEALDVVDNGSGTSYISRIPTPAGTPLTDTDHWALYGAASGAIAGLQAQIDTINNVTIPGVEAEISENLRVFETVADMKAADLSVGQSCYTLGYYAAYDGGAAIYTVVASSSRIKEALANGNYAEMQYKNSVNVLQLGAKGDGATDDLAIFQAALSAVNDVIVPAGHTYRLSNSLNITSMHKCLRGDVDIMTAATPLMEFTTGGVVIEKDFITIKNLSISTLDSSSTVLFIDTSASAVEYAIIKNVYLSGGAYGLRTEGTYPCWMFTLDNVRANYCAEGFMLRRCSPSAYFKSIYTSHCTHPMTCYTVNGKFTGGNFGMEGAGGVNGLIKIDGNCHITFDSCSFECDSLVSGNVFIVNSQEVKFENCIFLLLVSATTTFFATTSGVAALVFENTIRSEKSGSDPGYTFLDGSQLNAAVYGAIVYGKGCFNLPRPTGLTSAYLPNYVDLDYNGVINFSGTNINKTRLIPGEQLYSQTLNKACYYNGTNVVTVDGTVVV